MFSARLDIFRVYVLNKVPCNVSMSQQGEALCLTLGPSGFQGLSRPLFDNTIWCGACTPQSLHTPVPTPQSQPPTRHTTTTGNKWSVIATCVATCGHLCGHLCGPKRPLKWPLVWATKCQLWAIIGNYWQLLMPLVWPLKWPLKWPLTAD